MRLITLKIRPKSPFGTYPKGDTLFGQIVADFFQSGDNSFIGYTDENVLPKLVVSDMFPFGFFPRPSLPFGCFCDGGDKKQLRGRGFIKIEHLQSGDFMKSEKIEFIKEANIVKNSIDRVSFSTADSDFAPYGLIEKNILREAWMFILVDDDICDKTIETIKKIGRFGFGKNTSIGKGVFEVQAIDFEIPHIEANYYMAISPIINNDKNIKRSWYEPLTRFGKFGYHGADDRAFKKPVLMCESGAVVELAKSSKFFGAAINNGYADKPSFLQGYSIAVPIVVRNEKCLDI